MQGEACFLFHAVFISYLKLLSRYVVIAADISPPTLGRLQGDANGVGLL